MEVFSFYSCQLIEFQPQPPSLTYHCTFLYTIKEVEYIVFDMKTRGGKIMRYYIEKKIVAPGIFIVIKSRNSTHFERKITKHGGERGISNIYIFFFSDLCIFLPTVFQCTLKIALTLSGESEQKLLLLVMRFIPLLKCHIDDGQECAVRVRISNHQWITNSQFSN